MPLGAWGFKSPLGHHPQMASDLTLTCGNAAEAVLRSGHGIIPGIIVDQPLPRDVDNDGPTGAPQANRWQCHRASQRSLPRQPYRTSLCRRWGMPRASSWAQVTQAGATPGLHRTPGPGRPPGRPLRPRRPTRPHQVHRCPLPPRPDRLMKRTNRDHPEPWGVSDLDHHHGRTTRVNGPAETAVGVATVRTRSPS